MGGWDRSSFMAGRSAWTLVEYCGLMLGVAGVVRLCDVMCCNLMWSTVMFGRHCTSLCGAVRFCFVELCTVL